MALTYCCTRNAVRIEDFERFSRIAIDEATAEHKLPTEPIPILTPVKLAHLVALLASGKENIWYNSGDWQAVRDAVKRIDHECIICKAAGRRSATRYVHHVKHLRDRPDLALSIYAPDTCGTSLSQPARRARVHNGHKRR